MHRIFHLLRNSFRSFNVLFPLADTFVGTQPAPRLLIMHSFAPGSPHLVPERQIVQNSAVAFRVQCTGR